MGRHEYHFLIRQGSRHQFIKTHFGLRREKLGPVMTPHLCFSIDGKRFVTLLIILISDYQTVPIQRPSQLLVRLKLSTLQNGLINTKAQASLTISTRRRLSHKNSFSEETNGIVGKVRHITRINEASIKKLPFHVMKNHKQIHS